MNPRLLALAIAISVVLAGCNRHALHVAPSDTVSASPNLLQVKQNPDKSQVYIFRNGASCLKSADYTKYVNTKGALKIKSIFDASGSYESKWEKARDVSPKYQELEAVFFNICYEYGEGRLSKEEYRDQRATYDQIRAVFLSGKSDDATLKSIARDVQNLKQEREEEKKHRAEAAKPRDITLEQRNVMVSVLRTAAGSRVHLVETGDNEAFDYANKIQQVFSDSGWVVDRMNIGQMIVSVNGRPFDADGLQLLFDRPEQKSAGELIKSAFERAKLVFSTNGFPYTDAKHVSEPTVLVGPKEQSATE